MNAGNHVLAQKLPRCVLDFSVIVF